MPSQHARFRDLDALRGIAAIGVATYHFAMLLDQHGRLHGWEATVARALGDHRLDLGKSAVFLFFLISGFVIPASIEPGLRGLERFALGRFFRLYPLYWAAIAAKLFIDAATGARADPLATVAANLTMVQAYLGYPDIMHVFWTLQVELTFYVLCALLCSIGPRGLTGGMAMAASLVFAALGLGGALVALATHHRLPLTNSAT